MHTSLHHPSTDLSFDYLTAVSDVKEPGPPHEALNLVLSYLPLFELLSMEEVCGSFRDSIQNDVLIWLDIVVDSPLNLKFSDEMLMKITSRANGRLRTLALMNCPTITDDGLQMVVERNPLIEKLYLPGCTGLTPEGLIRAVKTLTKTRQILKSIKINGIPKLKKTDFYSLISCFPVKLMKEWQPVFFHNHRSTASLLRGNNSIIDVHICRKCMDLRMIFACPRETCMMGNWPCWGCIFCIQRCEECGKCIRMLEEEPCETACADNVCLDCWLQLPKCSLCNKPYCRRHTNQQQNSSGPTGWVCVACVENYAKYRYYSGAESEYV